MNDDDEDKPTVVLDFNTLKDQLAAEDTLANDSEDLQFSVDFKDIEPLEEEPEQNYSKNIYLFDFKTDFFKKNLPHHTSADNLMLVEDLTGLNTALQEDPSSIICFHYNSRPSAINQLTKQIRHKFPGVKTLIIANNLSVEKAQQHHNSEFGANAYLSSPFNINDFYKSISSLED